MISRKTRWHLLVFSSSVKDNNKSGSWFIIILGCFASIPKDDNKLHGSLSSPNCFSLGVENNDDNRDPNSSSSLVVLL
jgi:hypothetical protein